MLKQIASHAFFETQCIIILYELTIAYVVPAFFSAPSVRVDGGTELNPLLNFQPSVFTSAVPHGVIKPSRSWFLAASSFRNTKPCTYHLKIQRKLFSLGRGCSHTSPHSTPCFCRTLSQFVCPKTVDQITAHPIVIVDWPRRRIGCNCNEWWTWKKGRWMAYIIPFKSQQSDLQTFLSIFLSFS